jgi:hypothetical protein
VGSPSPSAPTPATAAERRVRADHAALLDGVAACADAVASSWPEWTPSGPTDGSTADRATTTRDRVVPPLRTLLAERGLLDACRATLADALDATGTELPATPVAAPPYVAVTSVGPVLRATLPAGRLVLTLGVFEVERAADGPPAYVRRGSGGVDVTAELR